MATKTLISIDLDWFNYESNPLSELSKMLQYIPRNTPAIMTIEHHEFLPQLRKWIELGRVLTPFNVLNIDEHHDYYYNIEGTETNCGNWGYRLPLSWYDRYTWSYGKCGEECWGWNEAKQWLSDHGIKTYRRQDHCLSRLKTDIVAAIFCDSPDYLTFEMWDHISDAVEIVASHFGLQKAPVKIVNACVDKVHGWRMAPRPMVVC